MDEMRMMVILGFSSVRKFWKFSRMGCTA